MRAFLAGLTFLVAGTASAQVYFPADGIWQFPASNGSGLSLDFRDGTIGIGLYTYDEAGRSIWYSGAGRLVDGVLDTDLLLFSSDDGALAAVGEPLAFRLAFSSATTATLALDDAAPVEVRHALFGVGVFEGLDFADEGGLVPAMPDMRGRWVMTQRAPAGVLQGAHEMVFTEGTQQNGMLWFRSEPVPAAAAGEPDLNYNVVCASTPHPMGPPIKCTLYADTLPIIGPAPPPTLGEFSAGDLSTMHLASGVDEGGELVGFRVPAQANAPMPGIWQIQGRNGEGVTIDVRPDTIAVGVFGYDDNGDATWSLATGALVGNVLSADLTTFTGGACLSCDEGTTQIDSTVPMRLEFVGATRARLTIGDAEPLALSLLPFGAVYLDKPFSVDPGAEEFDPHTLPALSGAWVQTNVREEFIEETPPYPAAAYVFGDVETVSLDGETYNALLAMPQETWGPPHPFGGSYASSLACDATPGDDTADCSLINLGGGGSPPAPPKPIAYIRPWDISATRISGFNIVGGEMPAAVYLFRIPPRPATDPAR